MAEASRRDALRDAVRYPAGAAEYNDPLSTRALHELELPATASPASNPALNRSAEAVGRGVGTAVAGVRRLPEQFDRLRSRIHIVGGRQGHSGQDSSVIDAAMETAAEWRHEAEQGIAGLKGQAETYTYDFRKRTNSKLNDLRRRAAWRIERLQRTARYWLADARHWQSQRPLHVIAGCAAVALAAGVALRVWRSNSD